MVERVVHRSVFGYCRENNTSNPFAYMILDFDIEECNARIEQKGPADIRGVQL